MCPGSAWLPPGRLLASRQAAALRKHRAAERPAPSPPRAAGCLLQSAKQWLASRQALVVAVVIILLAILLRWMGWA
jgi:hypothetical protein